jgi:IclR family transcriptional regulator, pca regulon regulatory protein
VRSDGRLFSLTPRVLSLGWAYLSSLNLWEVTQPLMEELADRTKESCSVATLDLPDVVYVARMPTRRIMTISLGVGTRLPAHCTGMGRVLLAALPDAELDDFLAEAHLEPFTDRTIADAAGLRQAIETVRHEGWALVDQELEIGLRSIAAPLRAGDRTIAALNVAVAAARVPLDELRETMLPELLRTAALISGALDASRRNGGPPATAAG